MTKTQFSQLVERLSQRAQRHPLRYRLEVLGLAMIGYLYILVLLLGAIVLSIGVLVISLLKPIVMIKMLKIIWLPIWFAWSVLRALWVRFDPPKGRELKAEEAPALFAEIDRIRDAIKGPKPHHVLITDEYNAAVTQHARLGLLGWSRNYLILGLPLMSALSPDQLRAVIAHEFGHLGAGDSRMTGRIYHMRMTWARLEQQFAQRGGVFFRRFFAWFGPYFNAYSFVLARAQEYAADAASAHLVGAQPAAEALVLAQLGSAFQEQQVWRPVWQRVQHDEQPAALPYTQLLEKSRGFGDWQEAKSKLDLSMLRRTDWSDTHPALNDRLAALGQPARLPTASGPSAAAIFLGPTAELLARELDRQWRARIAGAWGDRYREKQAERDELAALEAALVDAELDREKDWRRALLAEAVRGSASALSLYRVHAARFPDAIEARFAMGRILLGKGDASGLELLDGAMRDDPQAIKPASELAYRFLMDEGREAEAGYYQQSWRERDELEKCAQAERASFGAADDYRGHGLDAETISRLRAGLATLNWVARVWLVRKTVKVFPERPAYLLLVKPHWYKRIERAKAIKELSAVAGLADQLTIAIHSSGLKALFRRATRAEGSEIHRA